MDNKNKRVIMTISVPAWMAEQLTADAEKEAVSVSEFIRYVYIKYKLSYKAITGGIKNGK